MIETKAASNTAEAKPSLRACFMGRSRADQIRAKAVGKNAERNQSQCYWHGTSLLRQAQVSHPRAASLHRNHRIRRPLASCVTVIASTIDQIHTAMEAMPQVTNPPGTARISWMIARLV